MVEWAATSDEPSSCFATAVVKQYCPLAGRSIRILEAAMPVSPAMEYYSGMVPFFGEISELFLESPELESILADLSQTPDHLLRERLELK